MSLDHIGELPEVREYLEWKGAHRMADAALAAADREVGRLKVCGNCEHHQYGRYECYLWREGDKAPEEPCHFEPSRWTRREAP